MTLSLPQRRGNPTDIVCITDVLDDLPPAVRTDVLAAASWGPADAPYLPADDLADRVGMAQAEQDGRVAALLARLDAAEEAHRHG